MLQQAFSLSFLILSFIFSLFSVSTADSNIYCQCSQLNFTSTTPYESNVNSLFTSLTDSASVDNFNKFETSPQSDDTVYGLFQCRGDVLSKDCTNCVANSINQLRTSCPKSKGGEIQLEACFVKYGDTSFFGAENKMEVCKKCGPSIGYNSDVLSRIDSALAYLVDGNGQYFRGGDYGSIQGVAQCTQDLSLSDCQDCLLEASGRIRSECETSAWGDMYLGKCYIRYADQSNLNPPNGNDNSSPIKRNAKKNNLGLIIGIIVSIVLGTGLTIFVVCFVKKHGEFRKSKKKLEAAQKEAKAAKEKAEKLQKIIDEEKKRCFPFLPPACPDVPKPPPFPPCGLPPCQSKPPPCQCGRPPCQTSLCPFL
ncbi:plasmodesmata-located protein 6-like [Bidens hawaiensis]|uniref:plasmodesmata-located protein 6-like n=1 Tax=Bidens hawaiensis TaxID=980011 RepID=UPI00404932F0